MSENAILHSGTTSAERPFVIDIGGEGRYVRALNVNPRRVKTFGPERGRPIPRLIVGRAESVPLPNQCADSIIVERTPLSRGALCEIARLAKLGAIIVLRHARAFGIDPHQLARRVLQGEYRRRECKIGSKSYQETVIKLGTTKR